MKGQLRIDQLYAFIVVDVDNTEGVPAMRSGDVAYPLMGADLARVDQLMPIVQEMADGLGKAVELVHFTNRVHVDTIEPRTQN